ncbi:MAG: DUF1538 domain-containing protein [Treponema sp.]|jgi:hypothetical protein|nr:DUF1538 domain-containing protein [Treponema sp.]
MAQARSTKKAESEKMSFRQVASMIASYASSRIGAQVQAVAFVVIYLFLAQTFVLKMPVQHALSVAIGVAATVLGLAFFLEGLFLGIMPLGEQCGLRLPPKVGVLGVAIFAVIIGVTATLAEPAIGFLKVQGSAVEAWDAPLLYLLLNRASTYLVFAIAVGVGLAVLLGVFRFLYGWRFKPAVFLMMPILVAVGLLFEQNPSLRPVANLAWDTGGVTTGPVTVPLVIALGVGVSKIAGSNSKGGASGLGVVTLASGLPVAGVFLLAFILNEKVPDPCSASEFFSATERVRAEYVAGSEEALIQLAGAAVSEGHLSTAEFYASFPGATLSSAVVETVAEETQSLLMSGDQALSSIKSALGTVLPLALVLILTILIVVRERIREADSTVLGLIFTVLGMFLFTIGMDQGISALGNQAGSALPRAYMATTQEAIVVRGVDESSVFTVSSPQGAKEYIWLKRSANTDFEAAPFDRAMLDTTSRTYRFVPVEQAVFAQWGPIVGYIAVLAFVYILGFGATLAEPSLAALGTTVEDMTTGIYKKSTLISMVAIGVGFGMTAGFARILFNLPLAWILAVAYLLALILTVFASEEFAAIAWDSAGVTTGPVTVPLVIATGLGIGRESGATGGAFGIVATASVFPILAVLISGILNRIKAKKSIRIDL